jgi:hypothetical protein
MVLGYNTGMVCYAAIDKRYNIFLGVLERLQMYRKSQVSLSLWRWVFFFLWENPLSYPLSN